MPANGRWDLIQRLKVNCTMTTVNNQERSVSERNFLTNQPPE